MARLVDSFNGGEGGNFANVKRLVAKWQTGHSPVLEYGFITTNKQKQTKTNKQTNKKFAARVGF